METLEKLRNGIDQLPKWLLLILVIVLACVSGSRGSPARIPMSDSACLTGMGLISLNSASISGVSATCIRPAAA